MQSLFEQLGGTYLEQGDYRLPNLTLPPEKERPIGVWGQRRLRYLKQHHKVLYYNLLTSGELRSHLANTEEQAQQLFSRLVKELAKKRRHNRAAQSNQSDGMGAEDEQYTSKGTRNGQF